MNLRSIDLNLLVILDALLDETHVSRAAHRVGLSQPAASAALQRCRQLFGDELLKRGRGTMRRTARAESLRAPLKSLLAGIADLVDLPEPRLKEIRQTLRLSMADYPALFVLPPLQRALQTSAPGIDLMILPWNGTDAARAALIDGTIDFAVSVLPDDDDDIHRDTLLNEHYVIALREGHPAADGFNLDRWLDFPHILVSGKGEGRSPLDMELSRIGRARRVGLVVPSFGMVAELLRGSDMIAMLPSRVAVLADGLTILPTPIDVPGFALHLAWHRRRTKDAGLQHVADLMKVLLAD
ncbi:lysR substrate binding domain protein (plasmid) [Ochrobactrum quorumnocens]|uniref:LysR substrate binding domain protein n=1 Tax=Ochrobactrum quorumnocens TaxID=271865 RepID=A0A248UQ18_9HYPH|nr:LysR substrate-binding domain-containing protein [[Ochrobactrum] quorumnocens]ASV88726.1 lysR substrate binding domain protein [[Ochrobactrum] quorumnocens]